MAWKECNRTEERLRFVTRLPAGEKDGRPVPAVRNLPQDRLPVREWWQIMANRIKYIPLFRLSASTHRDDWNGYFGGSTVPGRGNNIEAVDSRRSTLCTDVGDQTFFPVGVIHDLAHNEVALP